MSHSVLSGSLGINDSLDERVGSKAVAAMQSGAGALTHGIESVNRRASVEVHLNTATEVVSGGSHGDIVFCDVDSEAQALLVDIREVLFGLLGIFVSNIEIYEIVAAGFHLVVDSASHDITRSERQAFVVFLHKFLAIASAQHGAIAAHSLGNEE